MIRNLSTLLLTIALATPAAAQNSIIPATPWSKPYFARVDATFAGGEFHARWDISRCDCGDLHIAAEETLPGEIRTGELLLIGADALLAKGYQGHTGEVAALLDSPVLMMQLLFVLLQKAEPAGPAAVDAARSPELADDSDPILLDSGVAFGGFPAPWSVKGKLEPTGGSAFRYDFRFEFALFPGAAGDAETDRIELSGTLDYAQREFPVDDSLVLDGWRAAWLGMGTENKSGLTPGLTLAKLKQQMGL